MSRIEKDFFGERAIPADACYGVQTLRGQENFHITGIPMSAEPLFVRAFGYVNKGSGPGHAFAGVWPVLWLQ